MWQHKLKLSLAVAAMTGATFGLHAQMAQDPLLSRSGTVEPNILFILDDSGSMASTMMYQYGSGTTVGYQGVRGPNNDAECNDPTDAGCVWTQPQTTLWGQSPDVNLMYYDPRVRYALQVNADGSPKAAGALNASNTSFKVYFHTARLTAGTTGIFGVFDRSANTFPGSSTCTATVQAGTAGGGTGATFTAARIAGDTSRVRITVVNPGSNYPSSVRVQATCGTTTNTGYTTTAGRVNGRWDKTFTALERTDYFEPGFRPDPAALAAGANLALLYPNTASATSVSNPLTPAVQGTFPKFAARTDCVLSTQHCTWTEERQNYANWQLYHSNRIKLARTGIGLAFQPLTDSFRLGWAKLNTLDAGDLDAGVRKYTSGTGSVKEQFFTWLYGVNSGSNNGTQNRLAVNRAGMYFQRKDNDGPWGNTPAGTTTNARSVAQTGTTNSTTGAANSHASCRRAYTFLMTDGYYNADSSLSIGDWDSTALNPVPGSSPARTYTPAPPYADTKSGAARANTFADVAMKYWLSDLRNDLPNTVRATTTDPDANWQHMNFFAIGLGVEGTIPVTDANLQKLSTASDPLVWPNAPAMNSVTSIDDMWHATVNGRGKLLNAKTTEELERAVTQIMTEIGGQEGTQAGVAISSISISQGTRKYEPEYNTGKWTGNITAHSLNNLGATVGLPAWQVETYDAGTKTWSSKIPAHGSRNIAVGNNVTTVGAARAVEFKYTPMGSTLRDQIGLAADVTPQLIDYLRGDATYEDRPTTPTANALYRARDTKLGDIINSTPVLVKDAVDLNYEKLPATVTGYDSYRTHVTLKKARPEGVLFVGANDGMLHAFRDGTYNAAGTQLTPGGAEVFAFVPYAVLPKLMNLSSKTYVHQYYVDGPIAETDAYLPSRGGWRNLVLGSTGAGAGAASVPGVAPGVGTSPRTSVFAIDVTTINSSVTSLGTSSVAWEVSSTQGTAFENLGYMLHDVVAGVTVSGDWVAIFGNGYESKSCRASLFIVNLATGAKMAELTPPNQAGGSQASCAAGQRNGLGGVRIVRNAQRQIIGVYAGDLLGNMWKFNLSTATSAGWAVDLGGAPLFKAGATQPITAPPSVYALPMLGSTEPSTGYMVTFGTGKFYEVSDITNTDAQYIYGVWDKLPFNAPTIPAGSVLTDSSLLVTQTITSTTSGGKTFFTLSTNPVAYSGASAKRGWRIHLNTAGQRVVYPMENLLGRFLVADAISPANVSLDPCANATGGTGYTYLIDALDGAGPAAPVLDTNQDGTVDASDSLASGVQTSADGRNITRVLSNASGSGGSVSNEGATGGKTYGDEGVVHGGDSSIVGGGGGQNAGVDVSIQSTTDDEKLDVRCRAIRGAVCDPPTVTPSNPVRRQWRQLFLR
ncbi:hypothetical protein FN976_20285 [Caenimonas sedimenti]|uniref:PilY1 beta-propeller domain-containing protein n=1 Tax=Caenimonas sedimenti TaxID=2596921 RepID=A0A562ZKG8_9BURK|nr:PilC/PilY family type IV pilus protein [Caenimonas sedimenti]TWO69079.1 hypothetical protein FN976_20285 [Caenimonas sedimenti]